MSEKHLIFLIKRAVRRIEADRRLDTVDLKARAILDFVGEADLDGRSLKVTDILRSSDVGTAPTVYSRITELQKAGWIQLRRDPDDARAKLVVLSPSARTAFGKMSDAVSKLVRSTRRSVEP